MTAQRRSRWHAVRARAEHDHIETLLLEIRAQNRATRAATEAFRDETRRFRAECMRQQEADSLRIRVLLDAPADPIAAPAARPPAPGPD
jgi:hypothetical protein